MIDVGAPPRAPEGRHQRWRTAWRVALIGLVGLATAAAVILGDGNLILAALPVALAAGLYAIWRTPLRYSAAVLAWLCLSIDNSGDADMGLYQTPLAPLGDMLRDNLERSLHLPGVKFSGLEVLVAVLLLAAAVRRAMGDTMDLRGSHRTCSALRDLSLVYVAALGYAVANGLARGGSFQIWQVRVLLGLPYLFLFFATAFRGPEDHVLVGKVVLYSGVAKSLLSLWIYFTVRRPDGTHLLFTTNHGDSILYNAAIFVVLVHAAERPDRRRYRNLLVFLPILLAGMAANNRRTSWVILGLGLLVMYVLTPWRPWKRRVIRAVAVAVPVVALYLAAGWNSGAGVFGPVRMIKSLQSGKNDASTYWREVENWNIAVTMRESPFMGMGLGREYVEHMPNDDISSIYPEFKFWPHNSILGMLLFYGVVAFTGMWAIVSAVVFLAVRSYRCATVPEDRAAALWSVCVVLFCIIQAYGDIGAPFPQYRIFMALAMAVAGKLATATGAWTVRGQRPPDLPARRAAA